MLAWPAAHASEVAAAYSDLMRQAPDDLGGGLALLDGPPAPFLPAALRGAPLVAVLVLWTGEPAAGEDLLRPLRALAPAADSVGPLPYVAVQGMFERPAEVQVPTRAHADGGFLTGLPAEAIAAAAAASSARPSPLGSILFQPLGGAFARTAEDATPLGRRSAPWHWQAGTAWFEPADDDRGRAWIADVGRSLAPWSAGESYPNFILGADPERLRAAYGQATFARLQAVRAEWDPEGVLSAGHAIPLPPPR
jgi:FAD/FMN-containing dehydrogenase